MRILIVNEFIKKRGAEQIVQNLLKMFVEHGIDAKCLCFDKGESDTIPERYDIIRISRFNKLIFNPIVYCRIRKYINAYNPDIIICNNIFSSPLSVYRTLSGYKTIQIIHDFKIVCPTGWCVKQNYKNSICNGYKSKNCLKACSSLNGRLKTIIQLYLIEHIEILRKKYVDMLVSPSETLNKYLRCYGYNSRCINNPISNYGNDKTDINKPFIGNKIIYAGAICINKGILQFCENISKYDFNYSLDIYGAIDLECFDWVSKIASKNKKISFKGPINYENLLIKYKEYDYMIVPSICMDNYPTVVLEAMINGVVVIGTNRGGIPEMLENNRGIVYQLEDDKSYEKLFNKIFNLEMNEYYTIRDNAYKYVNMNNSYEKYYTKMEKLICEITNVRKNSEDCYD